MKNLTTAIYGKSAGSAFMSDIGGRLYKGRALPGAEYPFAVYTVVSDVPERTFTEEFENVLVQFSLYSNSSGTTEIETLYTDLKACYDEQPFTITDSTLLWMRRSNAVFQVEEHTTKTGTQNIWVYHVEFQILTSAD